MARPELTFQTAELVSRHAAELTACQGDWRDVLLGSLSGAALRDALGADEMAIASANTSTSRFLFVGGAPDRVADGIVTIEQLADQSRRRNEIVTEVGAMDRSGLADLAGRRVDELRARHSRYGNIAILTRIGTWAAIGAFALSGGFGAASKFSGSQGYTERVPETVRVLKAVTVTEKAGTTVAGRNGLAPSFSSPGAGVLELDEKQVTAALEAAQQAGCKIDCTIVAPETTVNGLASPDTAYNRDLYTKAELSGASPAAADARTDRANNEHLATKRGDTAWRAVQAVAKRLGISVLRPKDVTIRGEAPLVTVAQKHAIDTAAGKQTVASLVATYNKDPNAVPKGVRSLLNTALTLKRGFIATITLKGKKETYVRREVTKPENIFMAYWTSALADTFTATGGIFGAMVGWLSTIPDGALDRAIRRHARGKIKREKHN